MATLCSGSMSLHTWGHTVLPSGLPRYRLKGVGKGTSYELGNGANASTGVLTSLGGSGPSIPFVRWECFSQNSTIGLDASGQLWGWGYNSNGQLGGYGTSAGYATTPTKLTQAPPNIIDIASSYCVNYVLTGSGQVWGCGGNTDYQLGLPTGDYWNWTMIPKASGIKRIWAGGFTLFCQDINDDVYAWGMAVVGDGDSSYHHVSGYRMADLHGLGIKHAAFDNGNYAVVLTQSGTLLFTGNNVFGNFGIGDQESRYTWVASPDISDVAHVSLMQGYVTTIARKSDGTLWGAGHANVGQFDGYVGNNALKLTWTRISGSLSDQKTFVGATVGAGYIWAQPSGQRYMYSWGYGNYGALGVSGTTTSFIMQKPILAMSALDLKATTNYGADYLFMGEEIPSGTIGKEYAVANLSIIGHLSLPSGQPRYRLWGAGLNGSYQLGNGLTANATYLNAVSGTNVKAIRWALGTSHTIVLDDYDTLWGCGYNVYGCYGGTTVGGYLGTLSKIPGLPANIIDIAAGEFSSYILTGSGQVWACGRNQYGQIGIGTGTTYSNTWIPMPNASGIQRIWAGGGTLFCQTYGNEIYAWGNANYGMLGDNNSAAHFYSGGYRMNDICGSGVRWATVNLYNSMVLTSGDTLLFAGYQAAGQFGVDDTSNKLVWTHSSGISNVSYAIQSDSANVTLALKKDGTLWGCGHQSHGDLAAGSSDTGTKKVWTRVSGVNSDQRVFEAMAYGTCFGYAKPSGQNYLYSWGLNSNGACGVANVVSPVYSMLKPSGTLPTKLTPVLQTTATTHVFMGEFLGSGVSGICNLSVTGGFNEYYHLHGTSQKSDAIELGIPYTGDYFTHRMTVPNAVKWCNGQSHTVVLTNEGRVFTCGDNTYGQLGYSVVGSPSGKFIETDNTPGFIIDIAATKFGTLAINISGHLYSIGTDSYGELGWGVAGYSYTTWRRASGVNGLPPLQKVWSSYQTTYVQTTSGTTLIFGQGQYGRCGDGMSTSHAVTTPYSPAALKGIKIRSLAGDVRHTAIVSTDGRLFVAGENTVGRLLTNNTTSVYTFTESTYASGFLTKVVAGTGNTYVLKDNGVVLGVGTQDYGQLGQGVTTQTQYAIRISGSAATLFNDISANRQTFMGLDVSGGLWVCGYSVYGEGGVGYSASVTPLTSGVLNATTLFPKSARSRFSDIDTNTANNVSYGPMLIGVPSRTGSMPLFMAGKGASIKAYGTSTGGRTAQDSTYYVPTKTNHLALGVVPRKPNNWWERTVSYYGNTCLVVDENGIVWSAGTNGNYLLGIGSTDTGYSTTTPVQVSGLPSGIVSVEAGYDKSFAIASNGDVYAWGYGFPGHLGQGAVTNCTSGTKTGFSGIRSIHANASLLTLAVDNSGYVWWAGLPSSGDNLIPPNINTKSTSPLKIAGVSGVSWVSSNDYSTLFVLNDGSVLACGMNESSHFGDARWAAGDYIHGYPSGLAVPGPMVYAAHSATATLIDSSGILWCCGFNYNGQCAVGSLTNPITTWQIASGTYNSGVVQSLSTSLNTFIRRQDGKVFACGRNAAGQLGIGTVDSNNTTSFVAVTGTERVLDIDYNNTSVIMEVGEIRCEGTCNLFVSGYMASNPKVSGNFPLFVHGGLLTSGTTPCFTRGKSTCSGSTVLWTSCLAGASGSCDLKTGGYSTTQNWCGLSVHGLNWVGDDCSCFVGGLESKNASTTLWIAGNENVSGDLRSFVNGHGRCDGQIDLAITGQEKVSGSIPLALGIQWSGSVPLYCHGSRNSNWSLDLVVPWFGASGSLDHLVHGKDSLTSSIDLRETGHLATGTTLGLVAGGLDRKNDTLPAYLGGKSAISGSADAIITSHDSLSLEGSLFTHGHAACEGTLNLCGRGRDWAASDLSMSLTAHATSNGNLDLNVMGLTPFSGSMALQLGGVSLISWSADLSVRGSEAVSGSGPLISLGHSSGAQAADLYAQGHQGCAGSGTLSIHGLDVCSGSCQLSTNGLAPFSGSIGLCVGASWSGCQDLFTDGHIGSVAYLPLVIPWFGASGSMPCFTWGRIGASGDAPLIADGHISLSGSAPLFAFGNSNSSGSCGLWTHGHLGSAQDIPLCIHGGTTVAETIPAFIHGFLGLSGSTNEYVVGHEPASGSAATLIHGHLGSFASITLSLGASTITSGSMTCVSFGLDVASGYFNTTAHGHAGKPETLDLYVLGDVRTSGSVPATIHGRTTASGSTRLYEYGKAIESGCAPLWTHGYLPTSGSMSMAIAGPFVASGDIGLHFAPVTSGSCPLHLLSIGHGWYMFEAIIDGFGVESGSAPLYIDGQGWAHNWMRMNVNPPPTSGCLNLHLRRYEGEAADLYLHGVTGSSGTAPLYVSGSFGPCYRAFGVARQGNIGLSVSSSIPKPVFPGVYTHLMSDKAYGLQTLSVGPTVTMVIDEQKRAWICGSNQNGLLGLGGSDTKFWTVDPLQLASDVYSVTAGVKRCGIKKGTAVQTWGYGWAGICGYGRCLAVATNRLESIDPCCFPNVYWPEDAVTTCKCICPDDGIATTECGTTPNASEHCHTADYFSTSAPHNIQLGGGSGDFHMRRSLVTYYDHRMCGMEVTETGAIKNGQLHAADMWGESFDADETNRVCLNSSGMILTIDGPNSHGQYGNNMVGANGTVVNIELPFRATKVRTGDGVVGLLDASGQLWTAGMNSWGALGHGSAGADVKEFRLCSGVWNSGIIDFRVFYSNTYALTKNGKLLACGRGDQGGLGDGTTTSRPILQPVSGTFFVRDFAAYGPSVVLFDTYPFVNATMPLFMMVPWSGSMSLYTYHSEWAASDATLFLKGIRRASGEMTLAMCPRWSGSIPDSIVGHAEKWSSTYAFVEGRGVSGAVNASIHGHRVASGSKQLFEHGFDRASGHLDLRTNGHLGSSGSLGLDTYGYAAGSGSCPTYIHGYESTSGSIDLSIGPRWSGSVPMLIDGIVGVIAYLPLTIPWYGASGSNQLFVHGYTGISGSIDHTTTGHESTNDHLSLTEIGHVVASGSIGEVTHGHLGTSGWVATQIHGKSTASGWADDLIVGHDRISGSADLSSIGHETSSGSISFTEHGHTRIDGGSDLVVYGHDRSAGSGDLTIHGLTALQQNTSLFIYGFAAVNADVTAMIHGQTGLSGSSPLMTWGQAGCSGQTNLSTHGHTLSSGSADLTTFGKTTKFSAKTLFTVGSDAVSGSVGLYTYGRTRASGHANLVTWGSAGTSGSLDLRVGMVWEQTTSLFINGIIGAVAYLPLSVPWFGASGTVTLNEHGYLPSGASADLFVHGHVQANGNAPLFSHGRTQCSGHAPLATRGMFGSGIYLLGCGGNTYGQLGIGASGNYITQCERGLNNGNDAIRIAYPTSGYSSTIAVSNGRSLAVDTSGNVWMFGGTSGVFVPWIPEMPEMGGEFVWDYSSTGVKQSLPDAAIAVAATEYNSFAILVNGQVYGWGRNIEYSLGVGLESGVTHPVRVSGLTDVTQIAGGVSHTIFLDKNGVVWGCGSSYAGQIGLPEPEEYYYKTPTQITSGVKQITAGSDHCRFLYADGTLGCGGANRHGLFGDIRYEVDSEHHSVVPIDTPVPAAWIHECRNNAVFVGTDGNAYYAGENNYGQAGIGISGDDVTTWVQMSGVSNAVKASTTCGYFTGIQGGTTWIVLADGRVMRCGSAEEGGLANGSTTEHLVWPTTLSDVIYRDRNVQVYSTTILIGSEVLGASGSPALGLFISGPVAHSGQTTLNEAGHAFASGQTSLYAYGLDRENNWTPLFTSGLGKASGWAGLIEVGSAGLSGWASLTATGRMTASGAASLICTGHAKLSEGLTLTIGGLSAGSGSMPAVVTGEQWLSRELDLRLTGHEGLATWMPAVMNGEQGVSGAIPLYEHGLAAVSGSMTLVTSSHTHVSGDTSMMVSGVGLADATMTLAMLGEGWWASQTDLVVHGHSGLYNAADAVIHGRAGVTGQAPLAVFGLSPVSGNAPMTVAGVGMTSGVVPSYLHGLVNYSGYTYLSVTGCVNVSGSCDLVTGVEIGTSGFLPMFLAGWSVASGSMTVYAAGPQRGVSGATVLVMNGSSTEPLDPNACPTLDPLAAIQIPTELVRVYQNNIDALINQLGKNMTLHFAELATPCPNCLLEMNGETTRSRGIYKTGGPHPFARGQRCPVCNGRGSITGVPATKCIRVLTRWNPKDASDYGISVKEGKGIVRTKSFLTDATSIVKAKFAIVNKDSSGIIRMKVQLLRGPYPIGLRDDRYAVTFWEVIE